MRRRCQKAGNIPSKTGVNSSMQMKWLFLAALILLLIPLVFGFLLFSGRLGFLTLNTRAKIEVNGASINGELLEGRATAIVTTRGHGKSHSYRLFLAGDTDSTGDMGSVVDCNQWVAPRLPVLPETGTYPPCKNPFEDASRVRRWPLIDKGKSMQFVLTDQSTIRIRR
jgi:hypothetical protein